MQKCTFFSVLRVLNVFSDAVDYFGKSMWSVSHSAFDVYISVHSISEFGKSHFALAAAQNAHVYWTWLFSSFVAILNEAIRNQVI